MEGFLSKSHQFSNNSVRHFDGADEYQHIEYQLANIFVQVYTNRKKIALAVKGRKSGFCNFFVSILREVIAH